MVSDDLINYGGSHESSSQGVDLRGTLQDQKAGQDRQIEEDE